MYNKSGSSFIFDRYWSRQLTNMHCFISWLFLMMYNKKYFCMFELYTYSILTMIINSSCHYASNGIVNNSCFYIYIKKKTVNNNKK